MKASQACLDLIKKHEKCRLIAYRDPGGVLTLGWGSTGSDITEGLTWTQDQADARLEADVEHFSKCVDEECPRTSQAQFDACVDLTYNIGCGAFCKSSVARLHNAARYSEAAQAFGLWNKAAGKVLIELVRRRAEEAAMYAEGTLISDAVRVDVPVDAEGPKSVFLSKTMIGTATAGLGTAASVVSQVNQQAQTIRDTADGIHDAVDTGFHLWAMMGHHVGIVALALVVLGLGGIIFAKWSEHSTGRS